MISAARAIGILLLAFAVPFAASSRTTQAEDKIDSIYTDIAGAACAIIAVTADAGVATRHCPGIAGYSLLVQDDDSRMSIVVMMPDGGHQPLEYWQVVTTAFSTLGDKAEWRVKRQGGKHVPIALIVRVYADESSDPNVATAYLAVAKITPQAACVVAKIPPGAAMNLQARLAADGASDMPCLAAL